MFLQSLPEATSQLVEPVRAAPSCTPARAAALTGVLYFVFAVGAIVLSRQPGNVATLWYANAVGASALLWRARREWALLLASVALGNVAANLIVGDPLRLVLSFVPGNLIEVFVAGWLLKRYCRAADCVENGAQLVKALLLGCIAPGLLGALLGAATLSALGLAPFAKVWFTWFEGTVIGSASVLPLGLTLIARGWRPVALTLSRSEVLAVLLLACAIAVFAPTSLVYPYVYVAVGLIIVAAVGRFVAVSVGALFCSIIVGTLIATGIFQPPPRTGNYDELLFYLPLLLTLVPPLTLGATLDRLRSSLNALAEREENFRTLYDKTPVMMHSSSTAGHLVSANATWLNRMGYVEAEVVGRNVSDFLTPESRRVAREVVAPVFARDGRVDGAELQFETKTGEVFDVRLAAVWERDSQGRAMRTLVVSEEVTLQKEAEEQMRQAVHTAEAASRAKSQFLANMSHEIRTPMNAVIGLSYLLERTPLSAEQADTLGKIKLASKSLLSIINDVLDLSKIEAAQMHLERAPFVLGGVLSELSALSRLQADAKGVGFTVQTSAELPFAVEGDATRLRQVLTNLLSNAIKFTEQGDVWLSVEQLEAEAGRVRLRFVVQDSGIGIAPESLERLFTPFVQADTSTTRRFGGTGLGLSIVKQLVTLMGGQIGVSSTPREGSAFWVELDFAVCDESSVAALVEVAAPIAGPGLKGVRVLVTDDNPINLEVARRILEFEGAVVRLADHGQEAIDQLLANPQDIDVVLMDVQMPVLDGHDATRRIRSGLGLTRLPVIALTAGISTGEHERAAAAGINDVVAKPFDPPELVRCIRKYVQCDDRQSVPTATPPARPAAPPAWPRIEGIDAADASRRLGGDVALFGSLLRRLLDDFADLGEAQPSAELDRLEARLHNLKGSAGTLGAKALERLAGGIEDACRAGEFETASQRLRQLADELNALGQAAAPILEAARAATEFDLVLPVGPLDAQALAELLQQLKRFDLGAMDGFKALAPSLRPLLGNEAFSELRQQIDNLQFAEAASALAELEGLHCRNGGSMTSSPERRNRRLAATSLAGALKAGSEPASHNDVTTESRYGR